MKRPYAPPEVRSIAKDERFSYGLRSWARDERRCPTDVAFRGWLWFSMHARRMRLTGRRLAVRCYFCRELGHNQGGCPHHPLRTQVGCTVLVPCHDDDGETGCPCVKGRGHALPCRCEHGTDH